MGRNLTPVDLPLQKGRSGLIDLDIDILIYLFLS